MTDIGHTVHGGLIDAIDISDFGCDDDMHRRINVSVNEEGIVFDLYDIEEFVGDFYQPEFLVDSKYFFWEDLADWIIDR